MESIEMTNGLARTIEQGRDELTADETREFLDDQTRSELGLTLDEFLDLAERGELPDHPAVAHLILLTGARPTTC